MRLFVAVRPPADIAPAGVRDPHVTLCFLGDVDAAAVPAVVEALHRALAGAERRVATVGTRARRLGPRAVVVDVDGLDDLAAAVLPALAPFVAGPDRAAGRADRAHPDRSAFHAHLTVARRRRGVPAPSEVDLASSRAWRVDEVVLVRSELGRGPGGTARHTDVAVVPLAGAPPAGEVPASPSDSR